MSQESKPFQLQTSPEQMMTQAREMTGIDILDEAAMEPLQILHAAYNTDACLHEQGAHAIEKKLLRLLCNRLRMQRDFAQHPEIAETQITSPVFVYGQLRSGTTKVQKLLAASGDFHYLPFWQTYNPSLLTGDRTESPQARQAGKPGLTKPTLLSAGSMACHRMPNEGIGSVPLNRRRKVSYSNTAWSAMFLSPLIR